jgi:hypothetical protein
MVHRRPTCSKQADSATKDGDSSNVLYNASNTASDVILALGRDAENITQAPALILGSGRSGRRCGGA